MKLLIQALDWAVLPLTLSRGLRAEEAVGRGIWAWRDDAKFMILPACPIPLASTSPGLL